MYNAKIKYIEDKIPDIINLATNTTLNAKINDVKNEILSITSLASTTALTAVENKIPEHSKYITTPGFNKLTAEHFTARLAQANFASKSDIINFVKKTDFHDKLKKFNKNITKHVLVENELNELSEEIKAISTKELTKDLIDKFSILNGAKYFCSGILQNYFVFIPAKKDINYFSGNT